MEQIESRCPPVTVYEFINALKSDCREACVLYYYGKRWALAHHASIRLGCSKLRADLFYKLHVIENSNCSCGYAIENAGHFFFNCPNYNDLRINFLDKVTAIALPTLKNDLVW